MKPIIETYNLSKTFRGGVQAVQDVSLSIRAGELYGLFGPNGAGKSTLVRILATLLAPTSGRALVNGFDVVRESLAVRGLIGLVTADERSFYGRLSARENLALYGGMQNLPRRQIEARSRAVLALFGLAHKAESPVQSLSTGQMQRLNMARALIHDPPILFLDEPTKSMDVQTSDFVKVLIKEELIGRQEKTVVFISHELYEMDNFCDRVAILAGGRIQVVGNVAELGEMLPRRAVYRVVVEGDGPIVSQQWQSLEAVERVVEVSRRASKTVFDVSLADEAAWLALMEGVAAGNGRVESYRRVDDASMRRIVAHFSDKHDQL